MLLLDFIFNISHSSIMRLQRFINHTRVYEDAILPAPKDRDHITNIIRPQRPFHRGTLTS